LAKHILGKYCRISQLRNGCILNKICVGFTLIFLFGCLVLSNGKVLAENAVDIGKLCNLMVQVPKENPELNNEQLQVKLYKTADITKLWKYNTIGNYELMNNYEYSFINGNNVIEKIKVKLNEIDSSTTAKEWEGLAFVAKEVAKSEKPTAVATIADGKAVFQGLQPGLYLVEVNDAIVNGKAYRFMAYLISVPNYNAQNPTGEKIEYNVDTELKVEVNDNNITTQTTTFKPTENTTKPKAKTLKTPKNQPDETSKSYELAYEFYGEDTTFKAAVFRTDLKDMISEKLISRTTPPPFPIKFNYQYQNIDRANIKGFETDFKYNFNENHTFNANYTYIKTKDESTGDELEFRPKNTINLGLSSEFGWGISSYLSANYIGTQYYTDANNISQKASGYALFNAQVSKKLNKDLTATIGVNNIGDKNFDDSGYPYYIERRLAYVGINYKF
jgi:hypothetical protein